MEQQTIDIPRILVVPTGEVKSGFNPFTLKLDTLRYPAVSEELWAQYLRTDEREVVAMGSGGIEEKRLEDYVVSGLVDFDDVSYDDHADLLYDLAAQTVTHFQTYLPETRHRRFFAAISGTSPASSTRKCRTFLGGSQRLRNQNHARDSPN